MKKFLTIIALFISMTLLAQPTRNDWFVGMNTGATYTNNIGASVALYTGNWFTPNIGFEIGVNNIIDFATKKTSVSYSDANLNVLILQSKTVPIWIGETYGKMLFNVTRTKGCWDLILYPMVSTYYNTSDWSLGIGGGVINTFNVSKNISVNIDSNVTVGDKKSCLSKNSIVPSINIGVAYKFGGKHKKRHDPYIHETIRTTDTVLMHTVDTVYVNTYVKSRYVATFDLNSSNLKSIELSKIKEFMSNVDRAHKISLIGSADSKTGNSKRNDTLAINRANTIKTELNKMGFEDITILTQIDIFDDIELSRSVVIEIE